MLRYFDTAVRVPACMLSGLSSATCRFQVDLGAGEEAESDSASTLIYAPVFSQGLSGSMGPPLTSVVFFSTAQVSLEKNFLAVASAVQCSF